MKVVVMKVVVMKVVVMMVMVGDGCGDECGDECGDDGVYGDGSDAKWWWSWRRW